jgi:hypothetical protein
MEGLGAVEKIDMDRTLFYASPPKLRLCKLAVVACVLGVGGPPMGAALAYILVDFGLPASVCGECGWVVLLLALLGGIYLGIVSLAHIARNRGRLRGRKWAMWGIIGPCLWVVGGLYLMAQIMH